MAGTSSQLGSCVEQIAKFSGSNLASKVAELEWVFSRLDKNQIAEKLRATNINDELLEAARTIKRAAAQIDVVIHTLGILVLLPSILVEGENVQSLSLGAGTSEERRFDVETDRRVAEFTFIDWRGNDNTRLQKVFKDFYRLAEFETDKLKELWLTDDSHVLKYLRSNSSVRSATHKHRDIWEDFRKKHPEIDRVSDYYRQRANKVALRVYDRDVPNSVRFLP
ncbi:MAG TPA: hypothetical protein VKL40_06380 [Candidatus Angelobacter sp.]|nr:hypothetical protein [Candidatus Angelobacter sp.]